MSDEVWKPIPGLGGWYEVSSQGRVGSRKRVGGLATDRLENLRILKQTAAKRGGYPCVFPNGHTTPVHKLVAITFIGPKPTESHEVCHRDGDPTNNRVENLYWGTRSDNVQDMLRHGTYNKERLDARGERHPKTDLTNEFVRQLRDEYGPMEPKLSFQKRQALGLPTQTELAKKYGLTNERVSAILTRKAFKYVD